MDIINGIFDVFNGCSKIEKQEGEAYFPFLTADLHKKIALDIGVKESGRLACVCKKLNGAYSSNDIWKIIAKNCLIDKRFDTIKEGFRHNGVALLNNEMERKDTHGKQKLSEILDRCLFKQIIKIEHSMTKHGDFQEIHLCALLNFDTCMGILCWPKTVALWTEQDGLHFYEEKQAPYFSQGSLNWRPLEILEIRAGGQLYTEGPAYGGFSFYKVGGTPCIHTSEVNKFVLSIKDLNFTKEDHV
jgi:hypothetical protein